MLAFFISGTIRLAGIDGIVYHLRMYASSSYQHMIIDLLDQTILFINSP